VPDSACKKHSCDLFGIHANNVKALLKIRSDYQQCRNVARELAVEKVPHSDAHIDGA
jgi:hypothetical protein